MLELTHGRKSDERASGRGLRVRASVPRSIRTECHTLSIVQSAFNYWQLRAPTATSRKRGADFLERLVCAKTKEADWIFRAADAMRGLRARAVGLMNAANSV